MCHVSSSTQNPQQIVLAHCRVRWESPHQQEGHDGVADKVAEGAPPHSVRVGILTELHKHLNTWIQKMKISMAVQSASANRPSSCWTADKTNAFFSLAR